MSADTDRAFAPHRDQAAVRALLLDWRAAGHLDHYPALWRHGVYLSSRLWEPERSAHVWLDRQGSISGLALLWQRAADAPWRALERSIHPTVDTRVLAGEMRAWTEKRVHTLTTEQGVPLTLGVSACKHDARALAALCRAGYEASDGYNLYMARDLANLPPTPALARGFTIRPRAGEHDLGIYDRIGF